MRNRLRRLILRWHRWLGLASVPFVVLLVVTGVLLEHTEDLRLDERYISNEGILAWYGIEPAGDLISYPVGDTWVSWSAGTLYLNGQSIHQGIESYAGAAAVGPAIVVASDRDLYLFSNAGELIEKVVPIGVSGAFLNLATRDDEAVLILSEAGVFASDLDMISWRAVAEDGTEWPDRVETPPDIRSAILENYRGAGLPWERVVLDLHSGRLFGPYGPYLMDFAALMLILLAATGVYNWVRRR